ncbi:Calcineurin-like phosphoesterase [uncultured archaeon]|nr:Calcineurin-like phosphoesterase [uncultured archaeon]
MKALSRPPPDEAQSKLSFTQALDLDRIVRDAGSRNASEVNLLLDAVTARLIEEKEAGRLWMSGIDGRGERVSNGMWVQGYVAHLPMAGTAIIVGDTHSRPHCLEQVLRVTRFAERLNGGEEIYLALLGDYVDKPNSIKECGGVKVLEMIMDLKIQRPNNVIILPGNHDIVENGRINTQQFPQEVLGKYGPTDGPAIRERYRRLFAELVPLAIRFDNGIFAVHGGAASTVKTLSDVINPTQSTREQLIWNDPDAQVKRYGPSHRGAGFHFGGDALKEFLGAVDSSVLVRGHQRKVAHELDSTCLTLNSMDYGDSTKAYAVVDLRRAVCRTSQIKINYF